MCMTDSACTSQMNQIMAEKKPTETPMMKQFFAVKAEHPEAVLLFRCGDFYETYGDDALTASKVLGIVLTKRSSATPGAIPMAGFPYHSLETYLPRLVRAGYKVPVCDQLEDPKLTKKIVKRGITELVPDRSIWNRRAVFPKRTWKVFVMFDRNSILTECIFKFLKVCIGEYFSVHCKDAAFGNIFADPFCPAKRSRI